MSSYSCKTNKPMTLNEAKAKVIAAGYAAKDYDWPGGGGFLVFTREDLVEIQIHTMVHEDDDDYPWETHLWGEFPPNENGETHAIEILLGMELT